MAVSAKKGLREEKPGVGSDMRQRRRGTRRQERHRPDAKCIEDAPELILDHVGEGAGHDQRWLRICRLGRQILDQRGEEIVLALGECRLDAAARIVQEADGRPVHLALAFGRLGEVELDDLGGARSDQHQQPDIGAASQQLGNHLVEFVVHIGHAGEVALVDDGCGETRLGKDHHARRRLHQMGAGARSDDEEKRILHLAMQPDDRCQSAEDLVLAALAQGLRRTALGATAGKDWLAVHRATSSDG